MVSGALTAASARIPTERWGKVTKPQGEGGKWAAEAWTMVDILAGPVTSTRCVGHLIRLVGDLAPYRHRPAIRVLTDRVHTLQHATGTRTT
ncbi:hypothetical protein [Nocardia sp. alder85J]|uniref:hypothetical protein n=1 Tax=Nocardia sp. alder85J TaxID=2862949 RepID=UPI001CD32E4A|nr:hypothetical protein [Nocardia sp. alder85J]MCX4099259.1 hypothetical protein [Nocardia sp. alder85J]